MTISLSLPESTAIQSASYDTGSESLTVEFTSGSKVTYGSVPPEIVSELQCADSVGGYFHANIRNQFARTV
mgnify:CR=1